MVLDCQLHQGRSYDISIYISPFIFIYIFIIYIIILCYITFIFYYIYMDYYIYLFIIFRSYGI